MNRKKGSCSKAGGMTRGSQYIFALVGCLYVVFCLSSWEFPLQMEKKKLLTLHEGSWGKKSASSEKNLVSRDYFYIFIYVCIYIYVHIQEHTHTCLVSETGYYFWPS